MSRAAHHENESASQILVAVDLTAVPAVEEPGKSQILCTYYRLEHFSESFLPSHGALRSDRSSEKPQTHSGRQVRFFGKRRAASEKL